jgi:hypothetical protein
MPIKIHRSGFWRIITWIPIWLQGWKIEPHNATSPKKGSGSDQKHPYRESGSPTLIWVLRAIVQLRFSFSAASRIPRLLWSPTLALFLQRPAHAIHVPVVRVKCNTIDFGHFGNNKISSKSWLDTGHPNINSFFKLHRIQHKEILS